MTASQRLFYARQLTNLSRTSFCLKYNISSSSMAKWELGVRNLTLNAAKKIINYLELEGINITIEWLLEGKGYLAKKENVRITEKTKFIIESDLILNDLNNFNKFHNQIIYLKIHDDSCLPIYFPGDYLAGKLLEGEILLTLRDKHCLFLLESGIVCLRKMINYHLDTGTYDLECLNPYSDVSKALSKNVKIKAGALVTFFRRPLS